MPSPVSPVSEVVVLSDGREVRVGRVRFGALAEAADSPALERLLEAARAGGPEAGRLALAALPGLVEVGLRWSTEPRVEAAGLAAADARALFAAFLRLNPPEEMLDELKKWLGPVPGPLARMLAGLRTPTGSNSFSTSSPRSTAGPTTTCSAPR